MKPQTALLFGTMAIGLAVVGMGTLGLLSLTGSCDQAEQQDLPQFQAAFGFKGEIATFFVQGEPFRTYVITQVSAEGALAKAGGKPGDLPAARHGDGSCHFSQALKDSASGQPGEFAVVRGGLPGTGSWVTIAVPPLTRASAARQDKQ